MGCQCDEFLFQSPHLQSQLVQLGTDHKPNVGDLNCLESAQLSCTVYTCETLNTQPFVMGLLQRN